MGLHQAAGCSAAEKRRNSRQAAVIGLVSPHAFLNTERTEEHASKFSNVVDAIDRPAASVHATDVQLVIACCRILADTPMSEHDLAHLVGIRNVGPGDGKSV